jgi:predicted alpha/beta superfamily hydrolase
MLSARAARPPVVVAVVMLLAAIAAATAVLLAPVATARAADAPPAAPPPYPFPPADVHVLPRAANGRDYQIYVALPPSYQAQPARRYPVLYLCDGYWDFGLVRSFYGGLLFDKDAPEIIIVGLGYPGVKPDFGALRAYDYTPVPDPVADRDAKAGGHAGEFLRALETEIIPFVERQYRADRSFRVLGGSSLGGLFTLYAMFERPDLFQGYVAPSPAVEWAQGWLLAREAAFAAKHKDLAVRLFVSGASEEWPSFLAAIRRFDAQVQSRHYGGLAYRWRLIDGERHAGTKPESYNRGLRFVLAPLAPSANDK